MNYTIRPIISMQVNRKCKQEDSNDSMNYFEGYHKKKKDDIYYSEDEEERTKD
jgi:hypothetical protein